ncbi:hypothetical protein BCV70DRAFT_160431 [Testicularia cyperi]|uniref:Uncharacterized protein n=1 Tax=Testicularia cyperi TaxID=1882483 RepID=A0A317XR45_9BASI|nr:hypothetical protein BCV70DRAFT_160431 [Testicularia cyperi]
MALYDAPKSKLPEKKTFIATLAGGAFVVGLTGATIYGLRKAKLQAIKEAQELAEAGIASASGSGSSSISASSTSSVTSAAVSRVPSSLARNSHHGADLQDAANPQPDSQSQGAFALFRQMNASILSPSKASAAASSSSSPSSVFDEDSASSSSLPSVLRRKKAASGTDSVPSTSHQPASPILASTRTRTLTPVAVTASNTPSSTGATTGSTTASLDSNTRIDYSEMDSTLDFLGLSTPVPADEQARLRELESQEHPAPRSFAESPVGLSLKAFLIATSIVTLTSFAVVETTKYALGVESMDDFVLAMARIVPGRRDGEQRLASVAPHMKTQPEHADDNMTAEQHAGTKEPKSVTEALDDLGNATGVEDWVRRLKAQLDSERDYEVQRRFSKLGQSTGNDSISPSSSSSSSSTTPSREYAIRSPLEDEDGKPNPVAILSRYTLGISPVLPTTAFGVGLVSGMLTSGKRAGLVFMAENAHRMPDTVQGWYFYSKTKNYRVMLGAVKGGLKQGLRLGVWTTGFCLAERSAELIRSSITHHFVDLGDDVRDGEQEHKGNPKQPKILGHWTDGLLAGSATAAIASILYKLPKPATLRTLQIGILAGSTTGAIRDIQERLLDQKIGGVAAHT